MEKLNQQKLTKIFIIYSEGIEMLINNSKNLFEHSDYGEKFSLFK